MNNQTILHIKGSINTDFAGIKHLFDFYRKASLHVNKTIFVDFYHLTWFDANLSALLGSMIHKLKTENNLEFSTDGEFLKQNFDILYRNGFIHSEDIIDDERKSSICFRDFKATDNEGFVHYIENDLLCNRGMPDLSDKVKSDIVDWLIEIFNNIELHAKTDYEFFVCGQYFPSKGIIAFTMVDLGVGFLPAIEEKTKGVVFEAIEAIKWSLVKRNSTRKDRTPGGIGLSNLYDYLKENQGNMQIVTGDAYWGIELESTQIKGYTFDKPYCGAMINLFFNCK